MRKIISVVDDDVDVRSSIESYFRAAGFEVRTFESADAFLRSPERQRTDCLVTDLHMLGLNGMLLQQALNRAGRSFPVIVMTGYPTVAARAEAVSLGAAAFLTKPVDPDVLLEWIESVLEQVGQ